jgi:hypothetical protein
MVRMPEVIGLPVAGASNWAAGHAECVKVKKMA